MKMRREPGGMGEIPPLQFAPRTLNSTKIAITWPTRTSIGFARILLPIDFSPASNAALRVAIRLARRHDGRILLLHVAEPLYGQSFLDSSARTQVRANREKESLHKLHALVDRHLASGLQFQCIVEHGNPQHKILETAEIVRPDLIVLGRRKGSGLRRLLFGGVSRDVLDEAACPVLLINSGWSPNRRKASAWRD